VTTTSTTRFEQGAATFTGTGWTLRGPEVAAFSGGTAASSNIGADTASFTFTGTAVSWIGLKCNVCGIATVSIDGGPAISVNTAGAAAPGSPGVTSEVVFASSPLAAGTHTLVITVTGTTTSGGAHIIVDAFDVTGGAGSNVTRIEENNAAVSYTGPWQEYLDARASGGRLVEALSAARATLTFTGSAVSWIGARGDFGGIANITLDGVSRGQVDTYCLCGTGNPRAETQVVLFTASGLDPTVSHTLIIDATGTKNPAATQAAVTVDAFDVAGGTGSYRHLSGHGALQLVIAPAAQEHSTFTLFVGPTATPLG